MESSHPSSFLLFFLIVLKKSVPKYISFFLKTVNLFPKKGRSEKKLLEKNFQKDSIFFMNYSQL
ncbi:hypothetical protein A0128_01145 [Leptospira tipperaryensis]|uniref:Uncharacterized protein n=1 Tax=Leptospira tipperaryensis TaxID=2564040 RepID=A0A1D7USL6_9LEPT|nr:hypothetical protein A0128_01145 [Leptospira tipperaryensis]